MRAPVFLCHRQAYSQIAEFRIAAAQGCNKLAGQDAVRVDKLTDDALQRDAEVSYAQFRALANTIPNLAWMAHPDGWIFWYNRRWYEYTGTTPEEMAGWGWQSVHHPDRLPEVLEHWTRALSDGKSFELVFPLKGADGIYRPFLTRMEALRENGVIVGWFGSNTEITEQERARERLQMLINELNHRVKNTLATIISIAAHTFRKPAGDSVETFQKRVLALASVHDVLTRENWTEAPLQDIVANAIAHCGIENFDVSGPPVKLAPRIASAMAMTLHELCTNAVKHGALTVPGGRLSIKWTVETASRVPLLKFVWREHGGQRVAAPSSKGFGLKLIERSLASDMDAKVDLKFEPGGLVFETSIPLAAEILK